MSAIAPTAAAEGGQPSRPGLQTFDLDDLSRFTAEGLAGAKDVIPETADHWLFYAGRDDTHGILMYLHSRFNLSMVGNMYGYDDEDLNDAIWRAVLDPTIFVREALDYTQAHGVHEKKLLESDAMENPAAFASHFALIQSETHRISHTKGGILDGVVGYDGSMNWSDVGEGEFLTGRNAPGGPHYASQNNTLHVFTDHATLARFRAELDREYEAAKKYPMN